MRFPAVLLVALILLPALAPPAAAQDTIKAREAWQQARTGKLTIVDIRSPEEWRETGVAKGAWKVTIHGPQQMRGFLAQLLRRTGGDRTRPITLICATGIRSEYARRYLRRQGFTNVSHIPEGMMGRSVFRGGGRGWLKHHLPTEKP